MKTLFAKKNLFLRVAVGFVLGVILGLVAPGFSIATKVVGDLYLNLIKMMIIPIVFCAVFCGKACFNGCFPASGADQFPVAAPAQNEID